MSFEFDVFVSYSRRDSPFVEGLVSRLRDAGFTSWFDVEQVPGGADVQQTLLTALDVSRHVIAVITEHWLASDYTTWEISASQKDLHGDRVLVPLARMAFDARKLGPFLHRRNVLSWPEGDPEPDARFLGGLLRAAPERAGTQAEWARKGREGPSRVEPSPRYCLNSRGSVMGLLLLRRRAAPQFCGGRAGALSRLPRPRARGQRGIKPDSGEAGERLTIYISGENFSPRATVTFYPQGIEVISCKAQRSQLLCEIEISPDAPPGPRNVTVKNSDAMEQTYPEMFFVRGAPAAAS